MTRQTLVYAGLAAALGVATALTASTAFAGNGVGGLVKNPKPVHMQVKDVTLAIADEAPAGNGDGVINPGEEDEHGVLVYLAEQVGGQPIVGGNAVRAMITRSTPTDRSAWLRI